MIQPYPLTLRPLTTADLDAALAIQAASYPAFLREPRDAFASRVAMNGSYCLAATAEDGALVGYLLAHAWAAGSPPAVGAVLDPANPVREILFLHDLAVSAAGKGLGLGRQLVAATSARARADGLDRAELIAVEGAAPFWQRLGFAAADCPPALAAKVRGYGPDARWMTRTLSGA